MILCQLTRMVKGEHNHWNKYLPRIVEKMEGNLDIQIGVDYLQLICIKDGVIFHEVKVISKT